jgi:hypothetical protein
MRRYHAECTSWRCPECRAPQSSQRKVRGESA